MTRARLASIVVALLAASIAAAQPEAVMLRYRWIKGDVLKYRMTMQTDSMMSGAPGTADATFSQTMTQYITLSIEEVAPDGTGTLKEIVTAIRAEIQGPMGHIVYDSAFPTQNSADPMAGDPRRCRAAARRKS